MPNKVDLYPRILLTTVPTGRRCTHMNDATVKFRLPSVELERWRVQAAEAGESVSEWIRSRCNDGAGLPKAGLSGVDPTDLGNEVGEPSISNSAPTKTEESGEDYRASDVSRGGEVHAPRRRKSVSVGPLASMQCSHCGHGKAVHRGFGTACIQDDCRCGGFR